MSSARVTTSKLDCDETRNDRAVCVQLKVKNTSALSERTRFWLAAQVGANVRALSKSAKS